MPADELLASSGASHILRTSTNTVRALAARGELPIAVSTPIGAMFRREDVERLARERAARLSRQAEQV